MRQQIITILVFIGLMFSTPALAGEDDRALTDAQWQEDLSQMDVALRNDHFSLFKLIEEDVYAGAVDALREKIPTLDDQEIILEMAKIVSLVKDGHTRLAIPRAYPSLALATEYGHSGAVPVKFETLTFTSLPVSFYAFEDGLYITGATQDYQHLIGKKVVKIGNKTAEEALEAAKPYTFYENNSRAILMAADRLSLPMILQQAGLIEETNTTTLVVAGEGGEDVIALPSLTGELTDWVSYSPEDVPLWQQDRGKFWYQVLPDQNAIYVRLDEFVEFPSPPFSDFVAETLEAAKEAGVEKYILDLRHNSGGTGTWTTSFINGLSRSEFNSYGKLFVLIGRETFSASQMLLHGFEEFTYAMFVGEEGGSKPTHYGDSKKMQLANSGLTLRVSSRFWPSWMSGDFREANNPHIDAGPTSEAYFSGQDPALQAIYEYQVPETLGQQIAEQFRLGKIQNAVILLMRNITDSSISDHSLAVPDLVQTGYQLIEDGLVRPGYYTFLLTHMYFPKTVESIIGIGYGNEVVGNSEAAVKLYQEALTIQPENSAALAGLERLSSQE